MTTRQNAGGPRGTDIISNVMASLDHERDLLEGYLASVPTWLRAPTSDLAGGRGGRWYEALRHGDARYVRDHLRKPG